MERGSPAASTACTRAESAPSSAVAAIRRSMAAYAQSEDMITVGAYQKGSNAEVDAAIELHPAIENFLMQEEAEKTTIEKTLTDFGKLAGIEIPADEWQAT